MPITMQEARDLLERENQSHVLKFYDQLDDDARQKLLDQVADLDFDIIRMLQDQLCHADDVHALDTDFVPADVISLDGEELAQARAAGEEALRASKVGVILVAGGQGSRLGFDGPKGSFPIAPITGASLFEIHARKILALEQQYESEIPFYIMTSESNDGATRSFFAANDYFGLNEGRVMFFVQGMWPALTRDGQLVLDARDHIFMSPDGHGGTLTALKKRGMLADMRERGIEALFYFQVDNPLVEVADPAFIGIHRLREAQISVKVCAKRDPQEGLGVVVTRGDRNAVVEYTELTEEQKNETLPSGELRFRFGSVAIHVFARDFLQQEADADLPVHLAHKKVPSCDDFGNTVTPEEPNAYKFEKFIFDSIPDAQRALNVEFERDEEFSPVKNPTGIDSPETTQRDMILKWARWFDACGVAVPRDGTGLPSVKIEIDPCFALTAEQLQDALPDNFTIEGDILLK